MAAENTITFDDSTHLIPPPPADLEIDPDTPNRGVVDFGDLLDNDAGDADYADPCADL